MIERIVLFFAAAGLSASYLIHNIWCSGKHDWYTL
jgi:hypothetical protein